MLNKKQFALCDDHDFDYSGLKALFLNCTLKKSPITAHGNQRSKLDAGCRFDFPNPEYSTVAWPGAIATASRPRRLNPVMAFAGGYSMRIAGMR